MESFAAFIRESWIDEPVSELRDKLHNGKFLKQLASQAERGRESVVQKIEELLRHPVVDISHELLDWLFPGMKFLGKLLKIVMNDVMHMPAIMRFFVKDFPLMVGDVLVSSWEVLSHPKKYPPWIRFLVALWNFAKTPVVLTMVGAMKFTIPWQKMLFPDIDLVSLAGLNVAACWGIFGIFLGITMMRKVNLLKPLAWALGQIFPSRILPKDTAGVGPTWGDLLRFRRS